MSQELGNGVVIDLQVIDHLRRYSILNPVPRDELLELLGGKPAEAFILTSNPVQDPPTLGMGLFTAGGSVKHVYIVLKGAIVLYEGGLPLKYNESVLEEFVYDKNLDIFTSPTCFGIYRQGMLVGDSEIILQKNWITTGYLCTNSAILCMSPQLFRYVLDKYPEVRCLFDRDAVLKRLFREFDNSHKVEQSPYLPLTLKKRMTDLGNAVSGYNSKDIEWFKSTCAHRTPFKCYLLYRAVRLSLLHLVSREGPHQEEISAYVKTQVSLFYTKDKHDPNRKFFKQNDVGGIAKISTDFMPFALRLTSVSGGALLEDLRAIGVVSVTGSRKSAGRKRKDAHADTTVYTVHLDRLTIFLELFWKVMLSPSHQEIELLNLQRQVCGIEFSDELEPGP